MLPVRNSGIPLRSSRNDNTNGQALPSYQKPELHSHFSHLLNTMITVTSLHNNHFVINIDLIEMIQKTPDTIITLTTGRKIIVQESMEEIIEKILHFKRKVNQVNFVNGNGQNNSYVRG